MKKTSYIFFIFLISFSCYSQISGTIYDEQNLPIENVSVFLLKDQDTLKTTLSDKNGVFTFNTALENETMLSMSHISYETLTTKPIKEKTYFLVQKQYFIDNVSVTSHKKEKNNILKRALGTVIKGTTHVGFEYELATFIPSSDRNTEKKIKSLKYQLADLRSWGVKNNKYQPFRACIYTVDTITKTPKEKIYRSEKVRMTKNEKWFYVHIDSLDIKMPEEGLFIVFEVLDAKEYNNQRVAVKGGGAVDAIPTLKGKLYNPNNPNKSYIKRHYYHYKNDYWEFFKHFHFCMEFEFEK